MRSAPTARSAAAVKSSTTFSELARLLLASLVYGQRAPLQQFPVKLSDDGFHVCFGPEFHESESTGAAGFGIPHDPDVRYRDVHAAEKIAQPGVGDVEREISDKKLVSHMASDRLKVKEEKKRGPASPDSLGRLS